MECVVRFLPSEREIRVPAGTNLLEATRLAELPIASACGAGGLCARCGLEILQGADWLPTESPTEARAKHANRVDDRLRLACRIELQGDLVVTATYW